MRQGQNARRLWIIVVVFTLMNTAVPVSSSAADMQTLKVGDVAFELVRIPAGRFTMGSSSGSRDERPAREVTIADGLSLGRTEVTVRQFRAFAKAAGYKTDAEKLGWAYTCPVPGMHPHQRGLDWRRPGFEPSDDHPAVVLSHNDAAAFCRWLSEQTGRTCRLPTEAEWEYAARASRQDDPAGDLEDVAWHEENTSNSPLAVATKAGNPWGLHDMQGNASEWCLDVWRPDYRGAALDGSARMSDPTIPAAIWRYVLRGGGWTSPADHLRYGRRHRCLASFASPATGFRIAVSTPSRPSVILSEAQDSAGRHAYARASMPVAEVDTACPPERGHGPRAQGGQSETTLVVRGAQFEFVRVPAGEFLMGTDEGGIEKPVHKVRIGYDFEMGRTEVTVAQFRAFVEATGYTTDGEKDGVSTAQQSDQTWETEIGIDWSNPPFKQSDDEPVVCVSWYDAMAFCHWLSTESGQEIRLPSESEWEYACRAGTTGAYAGEVSAIGWYQYNASNRTHPVAQRQPNRWGLYDMSGNAWEWCLDFFTTSYEGAPTDGSPRWDLYPASDVVSRGGSFRNPPGWLGSAIRMGSFPDCSNYNNGFRIVRVVKHSAPAAQSDSPASAHPRTTATRNPGTAAFVPVEVELPKPVFRDTPQDIRAPRLKPLQKEPGPPFLAPAGTRNVALGKPVLASDEEPVIGDLEMITDGDKEARDGSFVELAPLLQHVTIDLQGEYEIYGIRVWHYHLLPRVYFDVIAQISYDPDFIADVKTLFNNDVDNSAGLGVGTDVHYVDTCFGEIFDAKGLRGRYIRLYSRGNTSNDLNHYTEVEVYGRPTDRG
jgi:formylglycine-generating enzyme required for sulfatase activity